MKELYPDVGDRALAKVLGIREYMPEPEKKVLPYPDNLVKALRIDGLSADAMTADQKAGLTVAVGQLRDRQQRTIRLKYEEHKKNDEIGKIMNRAAGTIGTYHTKAMRKLRWLPQGSKRFLILLSPQERMTGISPLRGLDRKPRRIYSINWTDCLSTAWNMPEEMMINR